MTTKAQTSEGTTSQAELDDAGFQQDERTEHSIHVKAVPEHIWNRARQNALQSRMPFRRYMIRLLAESIPFARKPSPTKDQEGDAPTKS
jgi:hypothetical protein